LQCYSAIRTIPYTVFIALHEIQTRSSDENSVCPSVRLSVCLSVCETRDLRQKKRKLCLHSYTT